MMSSPDPAPVAVVIDSSQPQPAPGPQGIESQAAALVAGFTQDGQEAIQLAKLSGPFKIHALVALGVCSGLFLLWTFLGIGVGWFPWFIFPVMLFGMSLSAHFYLKIKAPREWLKLHFVWYVLINYTLFICWMACASYSIWFVYPILAFGELLGLHVILSEFRKNPQWHFYITLMTYILFCLFMFFLDIDTGASFPWWIFPTFALAILVVIHFCVAFKKDLFTSHLYLFLVCQMLIFSIWVVCGTWIFPWFIFVTAIWGTLLFLHYYKLIRKSSSSPLPVPTTTAPPSNEIPMPAPSYPQMIPPPGMTYAYPVQPVQVMGQGQMPMYVVADPSGAPAPAMYPQLSPVPVQQQTPQ